jgi:hypothetical protein
MSDVTDWKRDRESSREMKWAVHELRMKVDSLKVRCDYYEDLSEKLLKRIEIAHGNLKRRIEENHNLTIRLEKAQAHLKTERGLRKA